MIRALAALVALACASAALAQDVRVGPIAAVANAANFDGELAVSSGKTSAPSDYFVLDLMRSPGADDSLDATWRWASVTKQMIAILVMQQVQREAIDLEAPISTYLPGFASANANTATIRHLLQHRTGLPNPDDVQGFYEPGYSGSRDPVAGVCAGPVTGEPGGVWSYNNCDYMILGAVLEAVTGLAWDKLFARDIAAPLGLRSTGAYPHEKATRWGMINGVREPQVELAAYGASAGLFGRPQEILEIDNALLRGDLLDPAALATMWRSDPSLGYMALGQWVFTVPLRGCETPVQIVERRGEIGAVQVRNFILPEKEIAVVAFARNKPFEFGEVWQGSGFSHDLLAAAACPAEIE